MTDGVSVHLILRQATEDENAEEFDSFLKCKDQQDWKVEDTIRPNACRACANKFCLGCEGKKPNELKGVKFVEVIRVAKKFTMLPGERNVVGNHPIPKSYIRPFTVPPCWSGSMVMSALTSFNEIQGDVSFQRSQKTSKVPKYN